MFSIVCQPMGLIGMSFFRKKFTIIFFSLKYRVMSVDLLPTHTMINVDLLYAESEAKGQSISNMPNI